MRRPRKVNCIHAIRDGYSLVELITLMVVGGIVLAVTTSYLVRLYGVDRSLTTDREAGQGIRRFSQQLRRDTHAADAIEVLPDGSGVRLLGGATEVPQRGADTIATEIIYSANADIIERQVRESGSDVAADRYRLPPAARSVWSVQKEQGKEWLTVEIDTNTVEGPAAVSAHRHCTIRTQVGTRPTRIRQ